MIKYLYDNKYPIFKIVIEENEYKDSSFNAKVYEVNGWELDIANTPVELELYLSCYIKWDSCSHLWFGEKDDEGIQSGYLHLCGADSFIKHTDLLNYLYYLAFKSMNKEPYDKQDVWPLDLKVLKEQE